MAIKTYTGNTFSIIVTWALSDGTVKDLTGATVEAVAKARGAVITLSAEVSDGAAGQVRADAPKDTFLATTYDLQIRVSKGGVIRTYADTLEVTKSIE